MISDVSSNVSHQESHYSLLTRYAFCGQCATTGVVLTSLSGNPTVTPLIEVCHSSAAAARTFITSITRERSGGLACASSDDEDGDALNP